MSAITDTIMAGEQLTTEQKLKVLTDARELLSDRSKWTQGAYAKVGTLEGLQYVPGNAESASMCVMGAVAVAAGLANVDGMRETQAANKLMTCSLGRTMIDALPPQYGMTDEQILENWHESEQWVDFDFKPEEIKGYDDDWEITPEGFQRWLKVRGFDSPLEWWTAEQEMDALEMVYNMNDYGQSPYEVTGERTEKAYQNVLDTLDRAIANLEGKG